MTAATKTDPDAETWTERREAPCGCLAERRWFLTDVATPVSLTRVLTVDCPCCGADAGVACGSEGVHANGRHWGDVCVARVDVFRQPPPPPRETPRVLVEPDTGEHQQEGLF